MSAPNPNNIARILQTLGKFTGAKGSRINQFLRRFETDIEEFNLPDHQKCLWLMRYLEGLPLSEAEKCGSDFALMKDTLLRKFEIRESEVWTDLRSLR